MPSATITTCVLCALIAFDSNFVLLFISFPTSHTFFCHHSTAADSLEVRDDHLGHILAARGHLFGKHSPIDITQISFRCPALQHHFASMNGLCWWRALCWEVKKNHCNYGITHRHTHTLLVWIENVERSTGVVSEVESHGVKLGV